MMEGAHNIEKYLTQEGLVAWKDFLKSSQPNYFRGKKITKWNEFCLHQRFPRENVEFAFNNFEPRDGDVLIVTFPKTGTTWIREIVRQILYKSDKEGMDMSKDFFSFFTYLEGGRPSKFKVIEELPLKRRYFSTHLPPELLNMKRILEKNVKVIFMLRNPKDQLWSLFNFSNNTPYTAYRIDGEEAATTWNEYFNEVLKEDQHAANLPQGEFYFDFIKRWLPHINDSHFIKVFYEDLVKQPEHELKRVASHIDVDLNDEELRTVKDVTHISSMLKIAENAGLDGIMRKKFRFIQKGGVGKWKNHFTVAQSEYVDEMYQEKLGDTDIKFTYC